MTPSLRPLLPLHSPCRSTVFSLNTVEGLQLSVVVDLISPGSDVTGPDLKVSITRQRMFCVPSPAMF